MLCLGGTVELSLFFDHDNGPGSDTTTPTTVIKRELKSESTISGATTTGEPAASSSHVKLESAPALEPSISTSSSMRKRKRGEEPSVSVSLSHGDGVYFGGSGGIQVCLVLMRLFGISI
jgi:hypothetical protein